MIGPWLLKGVTFKRKLTKKVMKILCEEIFGFENKGEKMFGQQVARRHRQVTIFLLGARGPTMPTTPD